MMNILRKRSNLPFSRKRDQRKEKSAVSFMHERNIICIQTQLDEEIAHEQTIINFVGSYLQDIWWALDQLNERNISFE